MIIICNAETCPMPSSQAFPKSSFSNFLRRMFQPHEVLTAPERDDDGLAEEHGILLRHYGELQQRCSEHSRTQAREIARLHEEIVQLRAQVIAGDKALAWEREKRRNLPSARTSDGGHERSGVQDALAPASTTFPHISPVTAREDSYLDADWIEHSLRMADLVISQTGCVSHSDFWRVQDHCQRTGKTCVLVEQPGALQILRIHPSGQTEHLAATSLSEKDPS